MKKMKNHLEFEIFQINFYFAKILTKLLDFKKLESTDQRLHFWRAWVKFIWNFTKYIEFYTWKSCIFHLENLEFSFENPDYPGYDGLSCCLIDLLYLFAMFTLVSSIEVFTTKGCTKT